MDDHMSGEMQHALDAYGKVAVKRFIDAIHMICIKIMMQSFPKQINSDLCKLMGADIDRLVAAPPDCVRAMEEYERKIKTLDDGSAASRSNDMRYRTCLFLSNLVA